MLQIRKYKCGKPAGQDSCSALLRMVADYRKLNKIAISDEFPLPK
jgi:hypothetical protein